MSDNSRIDAFPGPWLKRLEQLPRQLTVNVAGYPVTASVSRDELTGVYLPVLNLLVTELGDHRRIVAGLAGIPGSGKSTFAEVLARLADALLGMGRLVTVGMDGWHLPNTVLDARTTTDADGRTVPLRQRKGGPESFDVDALAAAVRALRAPDRTQEAGGLALPVYDRRLHDPVPDGIHIGPGTTIVLLEGNFLLDPAPPWAAVSSQLHPRFFLEHGPADARQRVIDRHIRGGATPEQAESKYATNDELNTRTILATAANADYLVRFRPQPLVERIGPAV